MIRIQCDCCGRVLERKEPYVEFVVTNFGVKTKVPSFVNLCEKCWESQRKAGEAVKDAITG